MKKGRVPVYVEYAEAGGVSNHEVLCPLADFGFGWQLGICTGCKGLFGVNRANPNTAGLTLTQIAGEEKCPICGEPLYLSLREYPATFFARNGILGSHVASNYIHPFTETRVIDVWELSPND